jgi:hypothetical protein
MESDRSKQSLFSDQALSAKKEKYGKVINPIAKFPTKYLLVCFIFIVSLFWFGITYEFKRHITLEGVSILKNKPSKIINRFGGYISKIQINNGKFVEVNQPIYQINSARDNECLFNEAENCIKDYIVKSTVEGYVEQFYKTNGDYVNVDESVGLVVPKVNQIVFEVYMPIFLNDSLSVGSEVMVEVVNPYRSENLKFKSQITYKSRIPVNRNNNRHFIILVTPLDNVSSVPVGSFVSIKIPDSSKTIFELIKK